MAGILVEASLAMNANQDKPEESVHYTPIARALSFQTLTQLGLPAKELLPAAERNLSSTLFTALKAAQESDKMEKVESTRAAHSEGWGGSFGRSLATGVGVVAGGLLIGVTGGLAAPAIAAVLAPLGIGGLLGGAAAPVVLGTLFGVGGGGLAGRRVRERWKGVEEFGFVEVGDGTKATEEEIEDLRAARAKMLERQAKENTVDKSLEKLQLEDEQSADAQPNEPEKDAYLDEKTGLADVPEQVDEEVSEEEAKAAQVDAEREVEEDRAILEEKLLHLSLQAGTRTSISSSSGSSRGSIDSPRPSLSQGADEQSITEVKKSTEFDCTPIP